MVQGCAYTQNMLLHVCEDVLEVCGWASTSKKINEFVLDKLIVHLTHQLVSHSGQSAMYKQKCHFI